MEKCRVIYNLLLHYNLIKIKKNQQIISFDNSMYNSKNKKFSLYKIKESKNINFMFRDKYKYYKFNYKQSRCLHNCMNFQQLS